MSEITATFVFGSSTGPIAYGYATSYTTDLWSSIVPNGYSNSDVYSAVFYNSVTSIGSYFFEGCFYLTSVTLPTNPSYTSISHHLFHSCWSLTYITIPINVTSIGDYAFNDCLSLPSIIFPTSVTTIGEYAFENCTNLKTATFLSYDNLTSANSGIFYMSGLTNLSYYNEIYTQNPPNPVSSAVTTINSSVPEGCSISYIVNSLTLTQFTFYNGQTTTTTTTQDTILTSLTQYLPSGYSYTDLTVAIISSVVVSIGDSFFSNCTSLLNVTLSNSVTTIGNYAFNDCVALTSITLSNSVTTIGEYVFQNCTNLKIATFLSYDNLTSASSGIFDTSGLTNLTYYNEFYTQNPPNPLSLAVTNINLSVPEGCNIYYYGYNSAFFFTFYNGQTTTITTSDTILTSLTNYVPSGYSYTDLTVATFGIFVVSIGDSFFSGCTSLKSVTLPTNSSYTTISDYMFKNCTLLQNVTIPHSVTYIGNSAFYYCSAINPDIINNTKVKTIGDHAFYYCHGSNLTTDGVVTVVVTVPNTVTSIGDYSFSQTYITQFTLPTNDSYTSMNTGIFNICYNLSSITIPDSVTYIGNYAFSGCQSLASIKFPDSITSIGLNAFYGCSNLTSVTLPTNSSYTTISDYTFYNCTALTSITITDSVTYIGIYAFSNCTALNPDIINNTKVQTIGDYAFYYCHGYSAADGFLTVVVTVPESVTSIGKYSFSQTYITQVTLPTNSLYTTISDYTFYNCTALISITIPDTVTYIGDYAFNSCSSLTSLTIPTNVTTIGTSAFYGCTTLSTASIINYETILYNATVSVSVFSGCTSLSTLIYYNCSDAISNYPTIAPASLTYNNSDNAVVNINNSIPSTNDCIIYYYSNSLVTAVTYSAGSLNATFLDSNGSAVYTFVAIPGDLDLIEDTKIHKYIDKAVISTFLKLKLFSYDKSVFESIATNLSTFFADGQLTEKIDVLTYELIPFVIKNTISNDDFKLIFDPRVKTFADEYPSQYNNFFNYTNFSIRDNINILE